MTHVLGLVPARAGSKGVPGKNLRPLGGEPLIGYTLRAAAHARLLTRTIVSTDSDEIAAACRDYGAEAPFLRPSALATDEAAMHGVVLHALDWLRDREGYVPLVVVLLQPTVPFRTAEQIDAAVVALQEPDVDAVVSVVRVPASHHPAWQLRLGDKRLERYDGGALAGLTARRQDLEPTYCRDGAIYAFRTEAFRRTGSIYGSRTRAMVNDSETVNIDTLYDWALAESLVKRLGSPRT